MNISTFETDTNNIHWALRAYGVVLCLAGAFLLIGGLYLMILGGSWYYAIAGFGIGLSGFHFIKGLMKGVWVYLIVFLLTLLWALFEVGFSFWPLVPRLIAPIFMAALALLLVPLVSAARGRPDNYRPYSYAGLGMVLVFVAYFAGMFMPHDIVRNDVQLTKGEVSETTKSSGSNWTSWGKTGESTRFVTFEQINLDNIDQLEVAWTARTGFPAQDEHGMLEDQNTPLYVDGTVYQCASQSQVTAIDGVTGEIKWQFDPKKASPLWQRCRTLGFYDPGPQDQCGPRIVLATSGAELYSLKASDGVPCETFGENGKVSTKIGLGEVEDGFFASLTGPFVARDKIVLSGWVADNVRVGEPSGVIRAFDVMTGEIAWAWDLGNPAITKLPPEGESYTRGTPNSWTGMAVDADLGMIYVPLGNATPDYYGGQRRDFDNRYNSSLVALNIENGREEWSFQTVHYDTWDYDLPSQPALADIPDGSGGTIPVVIQSTKRGEIFMLDRRDGTPVAEVEERPVPKPDGTAKGEVYSETQPFSVGLASVGTAPLSEKRMWGATPLDQLLCRIMYKSYRYEGPFTTQSTEKSIVYPGNNGGPNWGSLSVDQNRNLLVLVDMRMPIVTYLIPREDYPKGPEYQQAHAEYSPQLGLPYGFHLTNFMSPIGIPCLEPPWGTISAIDLVSGELVWQHPTGTAKDVTLPGLGFQNPLPFYIGMPPLGGPLTTSAGLTFQGGNQDFYLRAYNSETGEVVWKSHLPAGIQSTPMSYVGPDGRQYIVITAGGARYNPKGRGDYVVAFALPEK